MTIDEYYAKSCIFFFSVEKNAFIIKSFTEPRNLRRNLYHSNLANKDSAATTHSYFI